MKLLTSILGEQKVNCCNQTCEF